MTTTTQLLGHNEIAKAIRADWLPGKSASRILAALGHPGYGNTYAKEVLRRMVASGYSSFQVIFNGWGAEA